MHQKWCINCPLFFTRFLVFRSLPRAGKKIYHHARSWKWGIRNLLRYSYFFNGFWGEKDFLIRGDLLAWACEGKWKTEYQIVCFSDEPIKDDIYHSFQLSWRLWLCLGHFLNLIYFLVMVRKLKRMVIVFMYWYHFLPADPYCKREKRFYFFTLGQKSKSHYTK